MVLNQFFCTKYMGVCVYAQTKTGPRSAEVNKAERQKIVIAPYVHCLG